MKGFQKVILIAPVFKKGFQKDTSIIPVFKKGIPEGYYNCSGLQAGDKEQDIFPALARSIIIQIPSLPARASFHLDHYPRPEGQGN